MPPLIIELKKAKDSRPTLACLRSNGTRTWAKLHPFFPTHDLTHCALESVLGFREAFFGLVATGWDLDDFARPGVAARLPPEAHWAEHLVGLLERGIADDATGLNAALGASLPASIRPPAPLLSEPALERFRQLRAVLIALWEALPAGETLRVPFPADASCPTTA